MRIVGIHFTIHLIIIKETRWYALLIFFIFIYKSIKGKEYY